MSPPRSGLVHRVAIVAGARGASGRVTGGSPVSWPASLVGGAVRTRRGAERFAEAPERRDERMASRPSRGHPLEELDVLEDGTHALGGAGAPLGSEVPVRDEAAR